MSPTPSKVAPLAQGAVDVVRDALARIEEAAQREDDAQWLDLSRRFAVLLAPLREYLNGLQVGRDLPQNLAHRLEPLLVSLDEVEDRVGAAGLRDHVAALRMLVHEARSSSSR